MPKQPLIWNECPNCLTPSQIQIERCGACGLGISHTAAPVIVLDEAARTLIGGWGGLFCDVIQYLDDVICVCEGGVFRFSKTDGVCWRTEIPIITNFQINESSFTVSNRSFSLMDGKPISKESIDV